jgi:hypothetical protein
MNQLVRLFIDIVFHRRGPADVPAGDGVLGKTLAAYVFIGAMALTPSTHAVGELVGQLAVDVAIVFVLFGGLLLVTGRGHRLGQTLTALFGTGAVLSALSVPCIWVAAQAVDGSSEPGSIVVLSSMMLLVLLLVSILVTAHIVRSAMDWPYAGGALIAIVHLLVSLEIFRVLFPEAG